MFLETTPDGKIRKEAADYYFADPEGLGKYAYFVHPTRGDLIPAERMEQTLLLTGRYRPITLEGRNLFVSRDFYAFYKHIEEPGIEVTDKGLFVIAMIRLRQVLTESREALDNARLTADNRSLYLIRNKYDNIR